MVVGTLYNPELSTGTNLFGFLLMMFMGVLIFVSPLIGMRNRLVDEKVQRLKEISELLQLTINEIHDKVRNQADTDISEARSTMGALKEEKALIEKISTWPWNPGTIRGFSTTLILPIIMWFITRFLELNF
jgi:FtsZ-binding cell division protein ZapB